MQLSTLCLLLLPCLVTAQELIQVCDPDEFGVPGPMSDLPLPDAPTQFSATIEGNLLARSQSFIITEYYDQVNDRGKLEFAINGTETVGIYDYTLGEVFIIPDPRGGDCRVFEITPRTPFLAQTFGFTPGPNGTLHIGSPAAFLERVRENATTRYMGQDSIRGVPVHRWQSCVALPNNTYLVDYYFASQANWTYGPQIDSSVWIPIQFNLNASFYSARRNMVDNAYNIYTFVNYRTGPNSVPDEVFTVPTGLVCRGRIPGQPLPTLPNYLSARIELITEFMSRPVFVTVQEYYDYGRGLLRIDYHDRSGPISIVHDFNQGVQFQIRQTTNQCSVTPLSNISRALSFDFDLNSETPSIASPNQLTRLDPSYNYTYEGVTTIRGVEVDSWVSARDFERFPTNVNLTNAVYEVFFSRPGVVIVTEHSVTTTPVMLRAKLTGDFSVVLNNSVVTTKQSLFYDFFDVSTKEPHYDVYDVSSCYGVDEVVSLVLLIPGQLTGFDLGQLRENIRIGISNFTGVSPLQIAGVNIVDTNGTTLFVHIRIANLTTFSTIPQEQRVSADAALQVLVSGVSSDAGSRPFTIVFPPNITVTPSIHAFGRGRTNPSNCDTPTSAPVTSPPATTSLPTSNMSTTPQTTSTPTTSNCPPPSTPTPITCPPTVTCRSCPTPVPITCPPTVTCASCPTSAPTAPPPANSTDPTCSLTDLTSLRGQLEEKNKSLAIGVILSLLCGAIIGAICTFVVICLCRTFKNGGGQRCCPKRGKYDKQTDDVEFPM